jgi:hypothetical protein
MKKSPQKPEPLTVFTWTLPNSAQVTIEVSYNLLKTFDVTGSLQLNPERRHLYLSSVKDRHHNDVLFTFDQPIQTPYQFYPAVYLTATEHSEFFSMMKIVFGYTWSHRNEVLHLATGEKIYMSHNTTDLCCYTLDEQGEITNKPRTKKRRLLFAQLLYLSRKGRYSHPDGEFDDSNRWYPDENERAACCSSIREPSAKYPYSLLTHCRSAGHIAQLCNIASTAEIKRPPAAPPERKTKANKAIKQELEDLEDGLFF